MFESKTYENILNTMLDSIDDSFDKREGSIIFDALSPAALELANMYFSFDCMLNEAFGDTATRDYLIRLAAERGIKPKPASNAVLRAEFKPNTLELKVGERFNCTNATYVITEKIENGAYKVECEEPGTIGNDYVGTIIPISYIEGLESATITQVLIYGEDEEDTESLRTRYMNSFDEKAFSGNKADYIKKTLDINGVGAVKIEPVFNGAGTVRLTLLDSMFGAASSELVKKVQNEFDPNSDGMGNGLAPIGHIVTVRAADTVTINVTMTITFDTGYSWSTHRTQIEKVIKSYLLSLRESWSSNDSLIVRISQIESKVLSVDGVIDVADTTINGNASNLTIEPYSVPIFGGVNQ